MEIGIGDGTARKTYVVDVASKMACECSTEGALASAGRAVEEISTPVRNTTFGKVGTPRIV